MERRTPEAPCLVPGEDGLMEPLPGNLGGVLPREWEYSGSDGFLSGTSRGNGQGRGGLLAGAL